MADAASAAGPIAPRRGDDLSRSGGRDRRCNDNIAQASNKVFVLRGDSWAELPSLNHARAAPAAATVGDRIVVTGGQNDKKIVPQTEVFDGTSWKQAADEPTPREHSAAVSDGSYFYVIGGRFLSSDKNSAAFDRFDPESGKWTSLPDMPNPHGSYGAAFIHGRIVAVGGEEPTQVIATADMYDIAESKWITLDSDAHPTARRGRRRGGQHRVLHRRRKPAHP